MHLAKRIVKSWLLRRKEDGLVLGRDLDLTGNCYGRHVQLHDRVRMWWSSVGDYSYVGTGSTVINTRIGNFCSIASDVILGTGSHPARSSVSSHPAFYLRRPHLGWSFADHDGHDEFAATCVGHDVWIGARAIIRDGVTIGDGAIIGAGAVVVKDVEPYTICGGVPATVIRPRFSADDIAYLRSLEWWRKDDAWLKRHSASFADLEALRQALEEDAW